MDLTHASFFSGVGGLDLGLERAGWTTVSFSEIDNYASAVLAERWPGVPNLGDIIEVAGRAARERIPDPSRREPSAGRIVGDGPAPPVHDPADELLEGLQGEGDGDRLPGDGSGPESGEPGRGPLADWRTATLWTGGFPCQDLSIAGARKGFKGDRSSLAFTFLDLVERYRPPAILFENVPGLLSSHGGRDMARLLREMAELGYGVAWRSLDAQYFGVPQRRLRVFLVGLRSGPDDPDGHLAALRAAEVLAVGTRCGGHPAPGSKKGPKAAGGPRTGLEIAGGLTRRYGKGVNTTLDDGALVVGLTGHLAKGGASGSGDGETANLVFSPPSDVRGDGAADGTTRRVDAGHGVEVAEAQDRPWRVVCPECHDWACGRHRGHIGENCSCWPCDDCGDLFEDLDKDGLCDYCARKVPNAVFVKARRAQTVEDEETWVEGQVSPTINIFDSGDTRATALVAPTVNSNKTGGWRFDADQAESLVEGPSGQEDPLLPMGLDSNRYRACGNAVVVNVAEWIGHRLRHALEEA